MSRMFTAPIEDKKITVRTLPIHQFHSSGDAVSFPLSNRQAVLFVERFIFIRIIARIATVNRTIQNNRRI